MHVIESIDDEITSQEVDIFISNLLSYDVITEEQANMLKELGCTSMQGYYFYKPLNVESFEKVSETA